MTDALFDIDDDGLDQGFTVVAGQTFKLKLRANPAVGVQSVRFQVWDPTAESNGTIASNPPKASPNAPLLELDNGTSQGQSVIATTPTSEVDMPIPGGTTHAWIVRCVVNNGVSPNPRNGIPQVDPSLIHERLVSIEKAANTRDIVATETTQDNDDGWALVFQALTGALGGAGVSSIKTTAAGIASPDTITPASAGGGIIVIDLPNVQIDTDARGNTVMGTSHQILANLGTVNSFFGAGIAPGYTGSGSTVMGQGAAGAMVNGNNQLVLGQGAASSLNGGTGNAVLGGASATLVDGSGNFLVFGDVPLSNSNSNINIIDQLKSDPNTGNLIFGAGTNSVVDWGDNNTVFGQGAGASITGGTAVDNVIMGNGALPNDPNPTKSVIIGHNSVGGLIVQNATIVGQGNLPIGNANDDTVFGQGNLLLATGTSSNTVMGKGIGLKLVSPQFNVFVGKGIASNGAGNASSNSIVGAGCAPNITSASSNTMMGQNVAAGLLSGDFNLIFGNGPAEFLTIGENNFIAGNVAGETLIDGDENILLGNGADVPLSNSSNHINIGDTYVSDVTTGSLLFGVNTIVGLGANNTVFGHGAGALLATDASGNTILGQNAAGGATDTDLSDAVIIGRSAFGSATSGFNNQFTCIGVEAGEFAVNMGDAVFVGYRAGRNNASPFNTFVGNSSGEDATGTDIVAVGLLAGRNAGTDSTFLGTAAGTFATGASCIYIGNQVAAHADNTGSDNSVFGDNAAPNLTSSSGNTIFGKAAAGTLAGGDGGNLILSAGAAGTGDVPTATTSNFLSIQGLITGDLDTTSYKLAIGTGNTDEAQTQSAILGIYNKHSTPTATDTEPMILFDNTDAANGTTIQEFMGSRDPNGFVTGVRGSKYTQGGSANAVWQNIDGATAWTDITTVALGEKGEVIQLSSKQSTAGAVVAAATLTIQSAVIALGKTHRFRVSVATRTAGVIDRATFIVTASRQAATALAIESTEEISGFVDSNYTLVPTITGGGSDQITLTFTNDTGTDTDNSQMIVAQDEVDTV